MAVSTSYIIQVLIWNDIILFVRHIQNLNRMSHGVGWSSRHGDVMMFLLLRRHLLLILLF